MTRPNWILESVEGDFDPCSVSKFLDVNREGFSYAECRAIYKLRPGETYSGGGGAQPEWTIRRQSNLQRNGLSPTWMIALALAAAGGIYFAMKGGIGGSSSPQAEYDAALREFASAKGLHEAALLRITDHPQDTALREAYNATVARLAAATTRIEAARAAMTRLGLPT